MKKALTSLIGAAAIAVPTANAAALAAKPKKTVVTKRLTVTGDQGNADRWGYVQVTLIVKKTTTTVGKKKTVRRAITKVQVPVYPNHTNRSIFINQQAVPMLIQEVVQAHYTANIDAIGGATDTSQGFYDSLQSALLKAKHV